jgi:hypothetical protein
MNTKLSYRIFLTLSALFLSALACGRGNGIPPTADGSSAVDQPNIAQTGDILFQDDFQDGQPDGWEITSAWYVQQSGDIYIFEAGSSGGAWVPQGGSWNNYAFETAARLDAGSLLLSFNLNQTGRYLVRLDEMGLYLVKEYPAKNYTVLAQTGPVSLGEWHQLDMRSYNGHIQVYVDGALWMDYSDTAPLAMGTIAVTTQGGSQAAVDDVLVTKTGPLPSGIVQAPPSQGGQPELNFESDDGMSLDEIDVVQQGEQQEEEEDEQTNPPELHISSVSIMPNTPAPGTQVIVTAYVFNGGDQDAAAFTVRWYPDSSDVVGCSWDIGGLAAGASTDTGGCVYPGYGTEGIYEWRAIADADNDVDEGAGEGNNAHSGTINVQPAVIEAPPEPPPAPNGCTGEAFGRTSVNFYWQFPDNIEIDGFRIYQGVTSLEGTVPPDNRGGPIDDLAPGTSYHFDVRAFNAAGESPADACFVDVITGN